MKLIFTFFVCTFYEVYANYIFQVKTSQGTVQGSFYKNDAGESYDYFLGIPYAQAPTGKNRFMSPKSPGPFTYRDGSKNDPNICVQAPTSTSSPVGNEDCLYLSIYTPSVPTSEKHAKLQNPKYPVMVWFHDGKFDKGSGNVKPDYLVHKGVIVVTVNYRLGVFGFLSFGNKELPGNMGLKDQIAALEWIKKEIPKFGGDETKITVFGSGAGAASIHYLLLCKQCKGLFQRAILQSGSAYNPWAMQYQPKNRVNDIFKKFQLGEFKSNKTDIYIELLQQDTNDNYKSAAVFKASTDIINNDDKIRGLPIFSPVIESPDSVGAVITETPKNMNYLKEKSNVQVMIGFNSKEGINLATEHYQTINTADEVLGLFIPRKENIDKTTQDEITNLIKQQYVTATENQKLLEDFVNLVGDAQYIHGIYNTAKDFASSGITTYFYRLSYDKYSSYKQSHEYKTSSKYKSFSGVAHGDEQAYFFRPKDGPFGDRANHLPDDETKTVQSNILTLWTNFAKTGNPTMNGVTWNRFSAGSNSYLDISSSLEMKKMEEEDRMKTWDTISNKLKGT